MKNSKFVKFTAVFLLIMTCVTLFSCNKKDKEKEEETDEYNPYPYEDLSVYMELPSYDDIKIKQSEIDKYINKVIAEISMKNNLYKTVHNRNAQNFDMVIIDFRGTIDDKEFEGGSAKDYSLVLGSGMFVPGFEDGVIDMKTGDIKDVKVTFPKDYVEEFAGKEAVFTITLKEIKEPPVIDKDFCKEHTYYKNPEEFTSVLTEECKSNYAWSKILDKCVLKSQPEEYTEYYQSFVSFFNGYAEKAKMSLEEFVNKNGNYFRSYGLWSGMSLDSFYKLARNFAESNTVNDLLLYSIIRKEGLETEGKAYDEAMKELLVRFPGKSESQLIEEKGKTVVITSVMNIQALKVLSDKVIVEK